MDVFCIFEWITIMYWIKPLFGLFIFFGASTQLLYAAPFTPDNDQQILETLPTDSPTPRYSNADDFLSNKPTVSPEQASQLLQRAYLQGDPRALGQARAQLDQSTDQSVETTMLRARALQSDHKFDEAKALLQQILAQDPTHADALLTLSSLLVVQGQFDDALSYCHKLEDNALRVYQLACIAQTQSMAGQLTEAKQTLNGLASIAPGLDDSTARWIYLIQADVALRSQDAVLAKQVFALMDTETVPALMARADWLLSQAKHKEVRDLLQNHKDKDSLLLQLIAAQRQLGDPEANKNLALMKERIDVWQLRQEKAHLREQASYDLLAKHTDVALELARENWQQQRETADITLYVTAALAANSQPDIERLTQFIKDSQFEYPTLERDLQSGKISACLNCQALSASQAKTQTSNKEMPL